MGSHAAKALQDAGRTVRAYVRTPVKLETVTARVGVGDRRASGGHCPPGLRAVAESLADAIAWMRDEGYVTADDTGVVP